MERNWNSYVMRGEIETEPLCYYETLTCTYYTFYVKIPGKDDKCNSIPVYISDQICNIDDFKVGRGIFIKGTLRSEREQDDDPNHNRLLANVEVREYDFLEEGYIPLNNIIMDGYICSKGKLVVKNGESYIKLLLAANRDGKSDYIWCNFKGERAVRADELEIGHLIKVEGPIVEFHKKKFKDGNEVGKIKEYVILAKWMSEYDEGYVNKDGYFFKGI